MMGATLANMRRHPLTGESVFDIGCVKDMLSIMFTCGMYDYSGHWAYRVGVPAKSGVSGGVLAASTGSWGLRRTRRRSMPAATAGAVSRCAPSSRRAWASTRSIA